MSGEGRWQTVGKKDHHQRRSVKGREERAPARDGIGQCMRRVSSHLFLLFSMTFLPTLNLLFPSSVGLRESSAAFSRFGEQQERGRESTQVEPRLTEPQRKPSRKIKPVPEKQHRPSFDDYVKEVKE